MIRELSFWGVLLKNGTVDLQNTKIHVSIHLATGNPALAKISSIAIIDDAARKSNEIPNLTVK